jgi:hypothetical protein
MGEGPSKRLGKRIEAGQTMIEWFDNLKLGMRFNSGETTVSREDIRRFAAEIRSAAVSSR